MIEKCDEEFVGKSMMFIRIVSLVAATSVNMSESHAPEVLLIFPFPEFASLLLPNNARRTSPITG